MRLALVVLAVVASAGCASPGARTSDPPTTSSSPTTTSARASVVATLGRRLPPAAARFSYQIGGAYSPPPGTGIVDRDRSAPAAAGLYSICYVNAFQAQPEEAGWWQRHHPQLLLRDDAGRLVIDTDWDEPLLDLSTAALRQQVADVVGGWIDGCAARGYDAVEADNLDSYTRSHGALTAADALAFAQLIVDRAHRAGLAIGQKNAADLAAAGRRVGFDFAVAEECQVYTECGDYQRAYGREVIEIEYTDNPITAFTTACAQRGRTISIALRDRDVTPPGDPEHRERWCH